MAAAVKSQTRNSRFYIGEVKNQMRNGFGMYVYPNNYFRYEGEWHKGEKHGHGKLLMKDGSYYEGEFSHGEMEGNGLRYWAKTGDCYSGQFSGGELHGYGVMQRANGERYEGLFSYGQRDGHGLLVDKDGQTYEGSFYQNKRHGEGQMHYRNGDQYEGGWLLDQKQGHGVMHSGDGSLYEGQWRNNLFNGQGMLIHMSGVVYEGHWMNGRPLGGASKMAIEGGDVLEVFQESPFCVEVRLQTGEGETTTGESGRVLHISAGVRVPDVSPTSSASRLKMTEDLNGTAIQTPFGFQVVSYPLMERAFESQDSRGPVAPLTTVAAAEGPAQPALASAVGGAKPGSLAVLQADSSVPQADSSVPRGAWESGSGSDGPVLGGEGAATPSYLDGKEVSGRLSGEGQSTVITESSSGLFTGQEVDYAPPPANRRVEDGQAKFQDLMLAPPPSDFMACLLEELAKKNAKKPSHSKGTDKQGVAQDYSDRRPSMGSRLTGNLKRTAAEGGGSVRPGEYVIMVKDVTSPPFLGQTLPPAFALLRVLPVKTKNKQRTDKMEKNKPK